jgi:hypothetical protein
VHNLSVARLTEFMTEEPRQPIRNRVRKPELICLILLMVAQCAVLVSLAARTGVTVDEPAHILSSILYWEGNDRLDPRDMPPLIKIAGGWAASEAGFRIVEESAEIWRSHHEWGISMDMIRRMSKEQIRRAMLRARLPMIVFPLATGLLLWWWARQMFPFPAALLLAALFAAEPTSLGHGPLYKNDHAATFGHLLFWYRAWLYWKYPGMGNAALLGAGLSVALLAKLSMLLLLPLGPLIVAARFRKVSKKVLLAGLLAVLLVPYLGSIAASQGEARRLRQEEITFIRNTTQTNRFLWVPFRIFRLIPVPMPLWQGFTSLLYNNRNPNAVYLLGDYYPYGHRAYFLAAAAVKSPPLLLILLAAGIALQAARARRGYLRAQDWLWLVPGALYFSMASLSGLQLGFRLVLPCLPFALLCMGLPLRFLLRRWPRAVPAAILSLHFVPLVIYYPHYIAYFNFPSGGPKNGLRYLSGSNIDWGQDLPLLQRFVREHGIPKLRLSYFGPEFPYSYFAENEIEWIQPPYGGSSVTSAEYTPSPGVYAISATLLSGQFFGPNLRNYFRAFREMKPIGYAGYSIYIYRVP